MATRAPFVFQDVEMWTGVDLMDTLSLIGDQDTADEFLSAYSELFENDDDAIQSIRYFIQIIAADPDDEDGEIRKEMKRVADMLGVEFPSASEVIPPLHTYGNSSYGVKVAA